MAIAVGRRSPYVSFVNGDLSCWNIIVDPVAFKVTVITDWEYALTQKENFIVAWHISLSTLGVKALNEETALRHVPTPENSLWPIQNPFPKPPARQKHLTHLIASFYSRTLARMSKSKRATSGNR
ncbi:hypothetical protein BDZ45DRAFT_695772 [Acephala macrosclerotiorum]|nr:hypothetical protein BDZ45DRAFT_695772 [Acephala macrosclerotiorum]